MNKIRSLFLFLIMVFFVFSLRWEIKADAEQIFLFGKQVWGKSGTGTYSIQMRGCRKILQVFLSQKRILAMA
ncbi:MAG: hypothetical protein HN769_14240 [Anaerolineae bacterium]|nr:hypothetical protein [Anaerolineae bacterium]